MDRDRFWVWTISIAGLAIIVALVVAASYRTAYVEAPVIAAPVGSSPVAPVIVQQPAHDGFWTGWFMGRALSGGDTHTREVHHYTTVPTPAPAYAPSRSYSTPASTPRTVVTPTVTRVSPPSTTSTRSFSISSGSSRPSTPSRSFSVRSR